MLHAFEAWANFYVIVGSSAGALTGLQFVVVALVADTHNTRGFSNTSSAFSTPTVVHFTFVLILAGIFAAPWAAARVPVILIGSGGLAGVIYTLVIGRRARRQTHYRPVLEDWLFHVYVPCAAYLIMRPRRWSRIGTSTVRSLASLEARCCCSLSASTTPGTRSPTSSGCEAKASRRQNQRRSHSRARVTGDVADFE